MRRLSKSQQYYQSIKDDRNQWIELMRPRGCMWCGGNKWPGLQCHEIFRRSFLPNRWWHTATALLLCGDQCHTFVDAMPHEHQLAVKWISDNEHFNLNVLAEMTGKLFSIKQIQDYASQLQNKPQDYGFRQDKQGLQF